MVSFVHDAWRRRVGKTTPDGSFTRFVYDAKRLLQESAADGSEEATYTTSTDEPYGHLHSEHEAGTGTDMFHQYDAQGSTEALSDDAGNALGPYAYKAFGLIANASMSGWADLSPDLWASMGANDWYELPVDPQSNFAILRPERGVPGPRDAVVPDGQLRRLGTVLRPGGGTIHQRGPHRAGRRGRQPVQVLRE